MKLLTMLARGSEILSEANFSYSSIMYFETAGISPFSVAGVVKCVVAAVVVEAVVGDGAAGVGFAKTFAYFADLATCSG